jgi:predicted dehydrogenase
MNLKQYLNRIINIADGISTRPNLTSWTWKGNASPLAFILLHTVYLTRICSLLQISKYVYRKLAKSTSIDKASKRINIPSYFVEVYFIIWAFLLFLLPKECIVTKWFSFYFLFESLFWLLYYFFFRRFFEERYAIMHTLEYIVILPLLVIIQARCISIISNCGIKYAFATMFFPEKDDNTYIIILSVFYTALIFGIFLSNLPIEQIKEKGNYRFNISIIGNGFIVQNRLKDAISKLNPPRNVAILDVKPYEQEVEYIGKTKYQYFILSNDTMKHILSSNILWIATPPFAHISYLNKYVDNVFIAIEKPLVTNSSEMAVIKQLRNNKLWSKVFCLSYYYLEKSLPLTFLYSPSTFYEKYLNFNNLSRQEILSAFEQLGQLNSIYLTLFEGEDDRDWVDSPQYGGHIFETFLHLAVIARAVLGEDSDWGDPNWTIENRNGHYMSYIQCKGFTAGTNIEYNLQMGKAMPEHQRERNGTLQFENGTIRIDFDKQEATGSFNDTNIDAFKINTIDDYSQIKYSIQVDMVERCFEENITPAIIDGSGLQIKTLDWLFAQKRNWSTQIKQT